MRAAFFAFEKRIVDGEEPWLLLPPNLPLADPMVRDYLRECQYQAFRAGYKAGETKG